MSSAQTPAVTIGLPVYNGGEFVDAAIRSIREQSFRDFELVVSDNASSDATEEICRRHASEDHRIEYLRARSNRGAAPNFNLLVDRARGRYFKWAAHDDLIAPTYLEECVAFLDGDPEVVLAHSKATIIDETGQRVRDYENPLDPAVAYQSEAPSDRFREMIRGLHACFEVFGLIRTDTLRRTGRIGTYIASDRVLLAELALAGKFAECPDRLFLSRDHSGRSVRRLPLHDRSEWFDTSQRSRISFPYWRVQRELRLAIGRSDLATAERRSARRHLLRSSVRQARLLRGDVLRAVRCAFSGAARSGRATGKA
ncbi:MAG: glycosyltransferase family A protein [Planctomycetota bacterium]